MYLAAYFLYKGKRHDLLCGVAACLFAYTLYVQHKMIPYLIQEHTITQELVQM